MRARELAKRLSYRMSTPTEKGDEDAIDPRFAEHYERSIVPQLARLETERIQALRTAYRRRLIVAGLCFLLLPVLFIVPPIALLILVGLCLWAAAPKSIHKLTIRERIFPPVLSFLGPGWHYYPGLDFFSHEKMSSPIDRMARSVFVAMHKGFKSMSEKQREATVEAMVKGVVHLQDYRGFGLLPICDDLATSDVIVGSYKNVGIRMVQCQLTTRGGPIRQAGGITFRRKYKNSYIVFTGLLITLELPQRPNAIIDYVHGPHILIVRDKGVFNTAESMGLEKVKLESIPFEKRYEVYSNDQIEARYKVTPTFMERLLALENLWAQSSSTNKCPLECAFRNGKLCLKIPLYHPWFPLPSLNQATPSFVSEINLILHQLERVFAIVDTLKLDDQSGL